MRHARPIADMSTTRRFSLLLALATSLALSSACLTTRAQTPADLPALDVPKPPDRVVAQVPPPEPPPPTIEPVEDIPANTKPNSPTKTNKPAPKPNQEPAKPDPKTETPPATDPAATPAPPVTPQLKLPESGDAGVLSRQIRDMIERTRRVLGQTSRAKLNSLRQKAFDDATLFNKQAEDALNANNLVFAKELAEKAERLSKDLTNR